MQHPSKHCGFSIIVPVLNEADQINARIDHIRTVASGTSYEIIIVDGHPDRTTLNAIRDQGVITVSSAKGRAIQMNAGASIALGRILIFLHADTKLPPKALEKIEETLADRKYVAGAFDLAIESERLSLKFIAKRASLRSRITRVPYGDQAIFTTKHYFDKIGRYKEIPLMEDIDLMKRIRKRGDKINIIRDPVKTSPRRWEEEGVLHTTARNFLLVNLHRLGVKPQTLKAYYKDHNSQKD
ncbi:MAG: TIGR04283 family arsenosugar biosynthesis glycosyltransferase [Planctomycetota bacterium]|jgi:rSAM/selenodomain-associated transferase 2